MQRLNHLIIVLAIFITATPLICGETADIPALLQDFIKDNNAPGVALAILHKGETEPEVYSAGVQNRENKIPFTGKTRIKAGSTTKVFTAYRIMMLMEEGELSKDTKLTEFFPDYTNGDSITIERLLTHSSGLPEMLMVEPFHSRMDSAYAPMDIWKMVAPLKLDFDPGYKIKYSNTNYLILGLIIEKLTGNSFNSEIRSKIIEPLRMEHAIPATDDLHVPDLATGYNSSGEVKYPISLIPPQATGGIIASAEDLVQLVNGYQLMKNDPLNPNVKSVLLTNGNLGIAPQDVPGFHCEQGFSEGFEVDYYFLPSVRIIGKLGEFPGFVSGFYYWPDVETGVAITTNQEDASLQVMALARDVLVEYVKSRIIPDGLRIRSGK